MNITITASFRPFTNGLMIYTNVRGPDNSLHTAFQDGCDDTFTICVRGQRVSGMNTFDGVCIPTLDNVPNWRSVVDHFLPAKYGEAIAKWLADRKAEYDERFPQVDEDGTREGDLKERVLANYRFSIPACPDDIIMPATPYE